MRPENMTANLPSRHFEPRVYGVGAWTAHLYFAYDLVALFQPAILVELGTDRGESFFAFCQSAAENKTGTRCFAVDTWRGDEHAGQYDEITFAQVTAHNRAHYDDFSSLMRCTFDAALDKFSAASIDLLHLDGLHSEEAVRRDVTNWLPKLRPGALLLLHDVAVRSRDFGVWKVWEKLRGQGRAWTFDAGPGLGVWQNPPNEPLPEPIENLFSGAEAERHELLQYYRARTNQLEERIAREWRDGTVRDLPFLQQTVIQVFHTKDGVHREEDSVNARIGHGEWKEISIPLPRHAGANPLRIDFVSPLTIVEITLLRLTDGREIVFEATEDYQFSQIMLAGDVERLPHPNYLRLKITGIDPQLYLPPISFPKVEESLVLKMRLRVDPETSRKSPPTK
jgi:hypothetical protein